MTDARHAWAAHYAAVKARIAAGRPRLQAPAPAPAPVPNPAPALPEPPALKLYKTESHAVWLAPKELAVLATLKAKKRISVKQKKAMTARERRERQTMSQQELENLCADILTAHSISWMALVGRGQAAAYLRPRLEVYRRLLNLGWSYSAIGRACQRDHSSIMYYIQKWGITDDQA